MHQTVLNVAHLFAICALRLAGLFTFYSSDFEVSDLLKHRLVHFHSLYYCFEMPYVVIYETLSRSLPITSTMKLSNLNRLSQRQSNPRLCVLRSARIESAVPAI